MDRPFPQRKHIRLEPGVYTAGSFFITMCTRNRAKRLSEIHNCRVSLTTVGEMVKEEWTRTPQLRAGVTLGEWTIMPDHMHAVIHLPYDPLPIQSLAALIRGFKGSTTRRLRNLVRAERKSLWQRGYYERIIRDEEALESVERYIRTNPDRWECRSR